MGLTPSPTERDADRVGRLRAGDAAAFEAIFREYHARLCTFADALVHAPDVAEEIVQDVFAGIWRTREALHITSSLRAYLYGAVRNRAFNHLQRSRGQQTIDHVTDDATADGSAGDEPDALQRLETAETSVRVREALARLPARCREVITLRWLHGMSQLEIAAALGITRKAVENHITRGLRALRDQLSGLPR